MPSNEHSSKNPEHPLHGFSKADLRLMLTSLHELQVANPHVAPTQILVPIGDDQNWTLTSLVDVIQWELHRRRHEDEGPVTLEVASDMNRLRKVRVHLHDLDGPGGAA